MRIGVAKENLAGECRVALVPEQVAKLRAVGPLEVIVQDGAGTAAGFTDQVYTQQGARIEPEVFSHSDVLLKVQPPTLSEINQINEGAVLISFLNPYRNGPGIKALAERRVAAFALELMPRITRAQSMDALSAMSTLAGYKAVLIAANHLGKIFPMLMTAAGTLTPARVFVIGAGVAGLQAIGTARRLGAVVEAYDTRPVVKEQVESLGAKFVELAVKAKDAEDKTGYAKAQSEEFYRQQQELIVKTVGAADVVITTALVPGKPAPVLISAEAVRAMRPGSVIVDLAAEQGGNCALTEPGQDVVRHGIVISGPLNLASTLPLHASQMYSRIVTNFLLHLLKDGKLHFDLDDELTRGPLVTREGVIVHDVVKTALAEETMA